MYLFCGFEVKILFLGQMLSFENADIYNDESSLIDP